VSAVACEIFVFSYFVQFHACAGAFGGVQQLEDCKFEGQTKSYMDIFVRSFYCATLCDISYGLVSVSLPYLVSSCNIVHLNTENSQHSRPDSTAACLWNQLPSSLHQPHSSAFVSVLTVHAPTTSRHSVNSPLSPSITPSVSFPAQDIPLSQIFPTTDSLPASGLTPRTL